MRALFITSSIFKSKAITGKENNSFREIVCVCKCFLGPFSKSNQQGLWGLTGLSTPDDYTFHLIKAWAKKTKQTNKNHTRTHTNTSADDDSRGWQGWEPNIHFPGWCVRAKLLQSCPTLCDPMDCSPPGSSVHGAFQARILEWVAMPSSIGSSQSRDLVKNKCGSKTKWGRSETLSSLTWWLLVKARKCHGKVLGGDGAKRDLRRRKEKGTPFN